MTNERFEELATGYWLDELDERERAEFERARAERSEFREEYEDLGRTLDATNRRAPFRFDERDLAELRRTARARIERDLAKRNPIERIADWFRGSAWRPALASGLAMLAVGFFVRGALAGSDANETPEPAPNYTNVRIDNVEGATNVRIDNVEGATNVRIDNVEGATNVRIDNVEGAEGTLRISYDAVTRVELEGTLEDPDVRRVVALALTSDENPGTRLRSVDAIKESRAPLFDSETKRALIVAATTDPNNGVRLEATRTLRRFPQDAELKEAYLRILRLDPNPGVRVEAVEALAEAVEALAEAVERIGKPDPKTIEALRATMRDEENLYVRVRSEEIIEGVSL
jgi:hypothetical protein